jgi:hypothetical protein
MASFFLKDWDYSLDNNLIDKILIQLKDQDALSIKQFSIGAYCDGISEFEHEENGLYFIRFPNDTYYVGLAGSCTLLERLAKHIDGRRIGGFNSLLRRIGKDHEESTHFTLNQEYFLYAKLLLLPVSGSRLQGIKFNISSLKNPLSALEEEIIYMMSEKGIELRNKRIKKIK